MRLLEAALTATVGYGSQASSTAAARSAVVCLRQSRLRHQPARKHTFISHWLDMKSARLPISGLIGSPVIDRVHLFDAETKVALPVG